MNVTMLAENGVDESSLPDGDAIARSRAAVDELMSRHMDVIVCHPTRASGAGRRDELLDGGAVEPPIVILTESMDAGASAAARTRQSPNGDPSPPPAVQSHSGARGVNPVAATAFGSGSRFGFGQPWHGLAVSFAQEIRAPLTLISEYCSLVRDGMTGAISAEQNKYLALASDQVDSLTATIQGICRLGDIERGALRATPAAYRLPPVFANLMPSIARKMALRGITLTTTVPDGVPEVYCDVELLECAMTMLACEVTKTAPPGATLQIDAQTRAASSEVVVSIGLAEDGKQSPQYALPSENESVGVETSSDPLRLSMAHELTRRNFGVLRARGAAHRSFEFTLPFADPEVVVARHIQARRRQLVAPRWVCLLTIDLDAPSDAGAVAAIEEAIHAIMHGEHLLFRLDCDRWLLVTEREQSDQDTLLEEFRRGWSERRRDQKHAVGQGRPRRLPLVRPTLNAMYQILPENEQTTEPMVADVEQPISPAAAEKPRILVVDDEPNLVQALRLRLTVSGFDVLTAADGQAGLTTAITARPQLVVLDIRMPKLDGLTVLDRLREHDHTKNIPVIIVSASHIDRRSALQRGARYFLEKPYDSQVLMTTIRAALSDPTLGGGHRA